MDWRNTLDKQIDKIVKSGGRREAVELMSATLARIAGEIPKEWRVDPKYDGTEGFSGNYPSHGRCHLRAAAQQTAARLAGALQVTVRGKLSDADADQLIHFGLVTLEPVAARFKDVDPPFGQQLTRLAGHLRKLSGPTPSLVRKRPPARRIAFGG